MELIIDNQAILATLAGVVLLLVLILRAKFNAFLALMITAIFSALVGGLSPDDAYEVVTRGMGGTLGFIAPVIGLGALFGAILESSGGVHALARGICKIGKPGTQRWSMGGLGIIAATPVFFDVALIILLPFVLGLARRAKRAPLYFGLPLCAGLAVGHAFVPPTPGPIAIAELIGADLGLVILFGVIVGVVSVAIAGPVFVSVLDNRRLLPEGSINFAEFEQEPNSDQNVSVRAAVCLISLPLVLILSGTLASSLMQDGILRDILVTMGHPFAALIVASGAVFAACRPKTQDQKARLNSALTRAFEPTGAVILVTGAGGAFKQVLVDTGAGAELAGAVLGLGFTPLLAGFVLALLVRLAQGSATVAMITAAGLAAPLVEAANLTSPQLALVTLSIAAGATGFSHVNDSGFWLMNRLFGLTEPETLRTWTLSTGIIALTALIMVCLLYVVV